MADAPFVETPPVILNTPGTLSQPPTTPAAPHAPSQGEMVGLGNIDPSKLSPELKSLYDNMYGDYQKKTTQIANERREWEQQRAKFTDMEKKFSDYEKRLQDYTQQEANWRQWAPLINGLNQPGRIEQALRLARGEPLTPQEQKPADTALQRLVSMADDEYVTGAQLNQYLQQIRDQAVQTAMDKAREGWQQYGQQAGQEILRQVFGVNQDYYKLFDQMFNLKMQHYYGLPPKDNALFDEQRIIDEANRLNLKDLNLVWQMLYGDQRAQQAAQMAQQSTQGDLEKLKREAYERGLQEGRLAQHNTNNPVLNANGAPLPNFNTQKPLGYASAEQAMKEALARLGVR